MPAKPKFPLSAEDVARSRREARDAFPLADTVLIEYAVAAEVIINVFGPEWYAEKLANGAEPYFVKDREDVAGRFVHQHRVLGLANDLLACQLLPGFAEQREKYMTRSLIGVMHELRVARLLTQSGHDVQFVIEGGGRGEDYDLYVDDCVPLEVKAKEDDATYSSSALASTLADARDQLPRSGPAVVALRIPDSWASDPAFIDEADREFSRALRNSRRLNAILVLWDSWRPRPPSGVACVVQFRVYDNDSPRTPSPLVSPLIGALTVDAGIETATTGVQFPES